MRRSHSQTSAHFPLFSFVICFFLFVQANTLYVYAETLIFLGELSLAKENRQAALSLRRELNQEAHHFLPPQLGLAHIAHLYEMHDEARAGLDQIVSKLVSQTLDGLGDPFGFYWLCYKLLNHYQDPRADALIEEAYRQLQMQADCIPDEKSRLSFLQNVPENRLIIEQVEQLL